MERVIVYVAYAIGTAAIVGLVILCLAPVIVWCTQTAREYGQFRGRRHLIGRYGPGAPYLTTPMLHYLRAMESEGAWTETCVICCGFSDCGNERHYKRAHVAFVVNGQVQGIALYQYKDTARCVVKPLDVIVHQYFVVDHRATRLELSAFEYRGIDRELVHAQLLRQLPSMTSYCAVDKDVV